MDYLAISIKCKNNLFEASQQYQAWFDKNYNYTAIHLPYRTDGHRMCYKYHLQQKSCKLHSPLHSF